jgi:hypothetical protein
MSDVAERSGAIEELIANYRATSVSFTMWGTKKTLSNDQKAEAAETFGADAGFLSAGKRLIDTKHASYRAVTKIKSQAAAYWQEWTLPFPVSGVRLIREAAIVKFNERMEAARVELAIAVENLEGDYLDLRVKAQQKLGTLYNPSDYPATLLGLFDITWDFPNVDAPEYLRALSPRLYEQERARISARFDEAVTLAEQAFIGELEQLVSHLAERVTGVGSDGKPKAFKDSTVSNLTEFFAKFQTLSIRSNAELDRLVEQAQSLVKGVNPAALRSENGQTTTAQDLLRAHLATNMGTIAKSLQGMLVDKPRRRVVRGNAPVGGRREPASIPTV